MTVRKNFLKCALMFIVTFHEVYGQGILEDGSPYFCVPPGICLGEIDPRIITPDGTPIPNIISCPAGLVPCYAQGNRSSCGQRATGKSEADGLADPDAYPWLGYLLGPNQAYMGVGSLISPYHVLTAAHKVLAYQRTPAQLSVYFGVDNPANLNTPPKPNSTAAEIIIHPNHNNSTLKNDIAIVRLANPISLLNPNKVNTLCLPSLNTANTAFTSKPQRCLVAGWGRIQPNNTAVPTQLKQVNVNTTNIDECEKGFSGKLDTSLYLDKVGEICAGGEAQKDACIQDGGAPLNCRVADSVRFTAAGIVIWGKSCGQPGVYGVYTNVPYYREWIVNSITKAT